MAGKGFNASYEVGKGGRRGERGVRKESQECACSKESGDGGGGQIRSSAVKIKEKCSNANIFPALCQPSLNAS